MKRTTINPNHAVIVEVLLTTYEDANEHRDCILHAIFTDEDKLNEALEEINDKYSNSSEDYMILIDEYELNVVRSIEAIRF